MLILSEDTEECVVLDVDVEQEDALDSFSLLEQLSLNSSSTS